MKATRFSRSRLDKHKLFKHTLTCQGKTWSSTKSCVACSRRSDSGERREEHGNGAENSKRKRARRLGRALPPLSFFPTFFFGQNYSRRSLLFAPLPTTVKSRLYSSGGGGGGNNFPYILLNEIQTMFSQLPKQSSRQ